MNKLRSAADLNAFRSRLAERIDAALPTIVIPAGTCGRASGADALADAVRAELDSRGLAGRIGVRITGCHGLCQAEPSLLIEPGGVFYPKVAVKDAGRIVQAVADGGVAADLLFVDPATGRKCARQDDLPFFRGQVRALLSRHEKIDPTRIDSYVANGGYAALSRVLDRGEPDWVIGEVTASGLRGRGGAGFPTGVKWELLRKAQGRQSLGFKGAVKYLVCNGDEGDPGAYMDRSVLEANPHSIIEGMLIGAFATGADAGVAYVRNEYPLAIRHLTTAIEQARALGLLGTDILGSGLSFDLRLVRGAGAFVCGEETALIHSIEGRMGEPRQRPPYPIERGINGRPTAINNVETWANIPLLIDAGADAFRRIGTSGSSGTKIFSLVGKIRNTGLVEVPMGMTIRQLVGQIGGGPSGDTPVKAVQTGGPSGGCIPAASFDLPIDYDSLTAAGSIMGSGGMIVMDESTCTVDLARYFTKFLKDESCGKCLTCREGTQRMFEILDDICDGHGSLEHVDLLEELARAVKDTTMCGLGQTAANPVLSTLRYFREEYRRHVVDKRCPAGVCKALITYAIADGCTGCGACTKACPAKAISGARKARHEIDSAKCVRCGVCRSACKFGAVRVA